MTEKERAMLEWCIKLTYSGMTLAMVRYWMEKRRNELLICGGGDADLHLPVQVSLEEERDERGPA